jgi:predicted nucleic acid-binding Zn ribbon protein
MPTYVYKFVETGETIEVQQAFTDPSLTEAVHPTTGATMTVKKVFTPVGVTFKGGGFYKTDSRGSSKSSSSSTSSSASDTASTGTSTSTSGTSTGSTSSGDSGSSSSTPAAAAAG